MSATLMVESFQIKMDFMNYATTVDPDNSVRPLYDQSLYCTRIELAHSISEENVCTC